MRPKPGKYLVAVVAFDRISATDQPVENISGLAGFGSVVSLRHHFRRAFGVSPRAWRRNFGGERSGGAAGTPR